MFREVLFRKCVPIPYTTYTYVAYASEWLLKLLFFFMWVQTSIYTCRCISEKPFFLKHIFLHKKMAKCLKIVVLKIFVLWFYEKHKFKTVWILRFVSTVWHCRKSVFFNLVIEIKHSSVKADEDIWKQLLITDNVCV